MKTKTQTTIDFPSETAKWMVRFRLRRRMWQAAISSGKVHAAVKPEISEFETRLFREKSIPRELKHLSIWRRRKQCDSLSSSERKGIRAI